MPDLSFVQPGRNWCRGRTRPKVAHVPGAFWAWITTSPPATQSPKSYNPSVAGISVHNTVDNVAHQVDGQRFLFDTVAQLKIISSVVMGLDLNNRT